MDIKITLLEFIVMPSLFSVIGNWIILLFVLYVVVVLETKLPNSVEIVELPFPVGIPKFKMAFVGVPTLVTVALLPAGKVVVVPTFTVAAEPGSPRGITKFRTALLVVPELVTLAGVPGAPVVVDPTVIVADSPEGPVGPGTGIKLLQQFLLQQFLLQQ